MSFFIKTVICFSVFALLFGTFGSLFSHGIFQTVSIKTDA
jgi:hypothetical protein